MNYNKIYNEIITRGQCRLLDGYIEKHHIIPRCMGGTDDDINLVKLTAKEHFICHKLLVEIYPTETKLIYALWIMSTMKDVHQRDYRVGSREYQRLKENLIVSDETRKKISKGLTGKILSDSHRKNNSLARIGKRKSLETRKKMSIAKRNMSQATKDKMSIAKRNMSQATKDKMSKSFTGRILSDETRKRISEARMGKLHSDDTIIKMKLSARERFKNTVICPYCNTEGAKPIMNRWHFNNCKSQQ